MFCVVSFSAFWSILEVFEQRGRVRKGWFHEKQQRKEEHIEYDSDCPTDTVVEAIAMETFPLREVSHCANLPLAYFLLKV